MDKNGFILPEPIYKNFNIIKQLDITEPQHSLILGSILNPNGKHGFGDIFLKEFFSIVVNDENFIYDNADKWFVTIEKGRFDISIKNKNSTKIIIIENKSNMAEDQQHQFYRYWIKGIYTTQYRLKKQGISVYSKIIYFSPSYQKQYTKQSILRPETSDINLPEKVPECIIKTVYFRDEILQWLERCMAIIEKKEDMYYYIKQYVDYWRNSMENETVNQVDELFTDKEQWISFWNLAKQKENIRNSWWRTFKASVDKCFGVDNVIDRWDYTSSGDWEFKWFLKEFGEKSLCLRFLELNGYYYLILWADPKQHDVEKIGKLLELEEEKFMPILSAFERKDEIPEGRSNVKLAERGNFYFGDSMDGHLGITRLAWYAHYKPEEFLSQILAKIDRFRKNDEVTELLIEINDATKK